MNLRHTLPALFLAAAGLSACSSGTPADALPTAGVTYLPECSGDNDGVIAPGELHFVPGLKAPYALQRADDTPVEVSGPPDAAAWDFTHARFEGLEELPTLSPAGYWYADAFPEANLVIPFDAPGAPPGHLLLRNTPEVLSILGVASIEPEKQLLHYTAPVPFMQFPMALGDARSAAVGLAPGSVWQGLALDDLGVLDTYTLTVDARGVLSLPGMSIDNVLALTLEMERTVPDQPTTVAEQTYLVHECLGTVGVRSGAGPWRIVWYPR